MILESGGSYLAIRRVLPEVVQNRKFLQEAKWGKGAINERKERIILGQGHFFYEKGKNFYYVDYLYGGAYVTDYCTGS